MTKKEMILTAIEKMGYSPEVDDDGDIFFRYQLKNMYVMLGDEDEKYVVLMMPQFIDIEEGEETLTLALCNKLTREVKMAKVYVDNTLKSVSASCEFFYTDQEDIDNSMENALEILGIIRTAYNRAKEEFEQ